MNPTPRITLCTGRFLALVKEGRWEYVDRIGATGAAIIVAVSYRECVLKAVNLGGDTDTTGCGAGGLAGVAYGVKAVPSDWISQLARKGDLDCLFHEFADLCEKTGARKAD